MDIKNIHDSKKRKSKRITQSIHFNRDGDSFDYYVNHANVYGFTFWRSDSKGKE
jgi:hypothetical protein